MLIKIDGMSLHEQIFEVLRANYFVNDSADLSRHMGRSRTYLSTLRYNGHSPSEGAYENLLDYLKECHAKTDDTDLKECLAHYVEMVVEELA